MKKPLNQRNVKVDLKRIELIDLMIACNAVHFGQETNEETKWSALHDKLKKILDEFDSQQTDIFAE